MDEYLRRNKLYVIFLLLQVTCSFTFFTVYGGKEL